MPNISIGLDFAWRLAVAEAGYGRHELIEPEHLFIGLCKVANLAQVDDWRELQLPQNVTEAFKMEVEAIAALFEHRFHDVQHQGVRALDEVADAGSRRVGRHLIMLLGHLMPRHLLL